MLLAVVTLFAALSVPQTALGGPSLLDTAEVSGNIAGAAALGFDSGAAGLARETELYIGQRRSLSLGGPEYLRLSTVLPVGSVSLLAGYERFSFVESDSEQTGHQEILGLGWRVSESSSFGVVRRHWDLGSGLSEADSEFQADERWELGYYTQPTSWLALSAGMHLQKFSEKASREISAYRVGVGLRPWLAQPWLSIGADALWRRGAAEQELELDGMGARLDVELTDGVGLGFAWKHRSDEDQVWGGLKVAFNGGPSSMAGEVGAGARTTEDKDGWLSWGVTWKARGERALGSGDQRVLIALDGTTVEEPASPLDSPDSISRAALNLHELAANKDVSVVTLALGGLEIGMADVEELRAGIAALKLAGKKVIARLGSADERTYLVASQADRILLDPLGVLRLDGFSVHSLFFAGTLEKIGVRFDAIAIGEYKTAPQALTQRGSSPASQEVTDAILSNAYHWLQACLRKDRSLSSEKVQEVLARGHFTAQDALDAGLVDALTHPMDPKELPTEPPRGRDVDDVRRERKVWGDKPIVRVIPIVGTIAMERGSNPLPGRTAGALEIAESLRRAQSDERVRSVVLRIDSPGGEVMASEHIWRAVKRLAAVKPVVVSMGGVAASGGYWVATPAARIFAGDQTLTGSIGIFSLKPDLSGLYELMGMGSEVRKQGSRADWDSTAKAMSEEERAGARQILERYHTIFEERVGAGRGLSQQEVKKVATGRVWTGREARGLGLVDARGGLQEAILDAAARSELSRGAFEVDIQSDSLQGNILWSLLAGRAASRGGLEEVYALMQKIRSYDGLPLALMPIQYEVRP